MVFLLVVRCRSARLRARFGAPKRATHGAGSCAFKTKGHGAEPVRFVGAPISRVYCTCVETFNRCRIDRPDLYPLPRGINSSTDVRMKDGSERDRVLPPKPARPREDGMRERSALPHFHAGEANPQRSQRTHCACAASVPRGAGRFRRIKRHRRNRIIAPLPVLADTASRRPASGSPEFTGLRKRE
jgi:hypothetical protein